MIPFYESDMITSVHNPRVKQAVRLRDHRQRRKEQLILIDGARELARAIAAGVALREVFVCPELCRSEEARRLLEILPGSGGQRFDVTEAVFAKLAFGQRAEGVVGVAAVVTRAAAGRSRLAGQSVGGRVGGRGEAGQRRRRAAQCGRGGRFGPRGRRPADRSFQSQRDSRQSGHDLFAARRRRRSRRGAGLAARPRSSDSGRPGGRIRFLHRGRLPAAHGHRLRQRGRGADFALGGDDVRAIRLPMLGVADSLNVSAAAAVLFYEALRQRT